MNAFIKLAADRFLAQNDIKAHRVCSLLPVVGHVHIPVAWGRVKEKATNIRGSSNTWCVLRMIGNLQKVVVLLGIIEELAV